MDPRSTQEQTKLTTVSHDNIKTSKMVWINNEYCATTGYSKKNERECKLWDIRNISKEIKTQFIDNQSGVIYPFYDSDTQMLYTCGRGEGSIKYFEVDTTSITPFNTYSSTVAAKAYAFFPKRTMNYFQSEQARVAKLCNNSIEYVSFKVPKRVN